MSLQLLTVLFTLTSFTIFKKGDYLKDYDVWYTSKHVSFVLDKQNMSMSRIETFIATSSKYRITLYSLKPSSGNEKFKKYRSAIPNCFPSYVAF